MRKMFVVLGVAVAVACGPSASAAGPCEYLRQECPSVDTIEIDWERTSDRFCATAGVGEHVQEVCVGAL